MIPRSDATTRGPPRRARATKRRRRSIDELQTTILELTDGASNRNAARASARIRDGRRVALVCRTPGHELVDAHDQLPSYGVRRIHASLIAARALDGLDVRTFEGMGASPEEVARAILAFDPDVVGFSAYVWSLPSFLRIARHLRDASPGCTIVFGGPSARPEMFAIEPYLSGAHLVDAMVVTHGEDAFVELVRLADRSPEALAAIPGVAVREADGFRRALPRASGRLDDLASPSELGLVPRGAWHYLETYRGCPMSCTFCQWGSAQAPKDVLSVERIAVELASAMANDALGIVHLDAGLTLNERAFRNLAAAEREVGFLRRARFSCEIYPAHLTDAHLDFLQSIGCSYLGVGLQSYDESVLRNVHRSAKPAQFDEIVRRLVDSVGNVAIEIILGLPGDSFDSFRRTAEHALELGADVHAFHCLVLPDAFLSKAPASFALDYDPLTLKVRSSLGWTPDQLEEARAWMGNLARSMNGRTGTQEWLTGRFLRGDVRPRAESRGQPTWPAPVSTPRTDG